MLKIKEKNVHIKKSRVIINKKKTPEKTVTRGYRS